ncbi:hypothetical protein D1614_06435 [Maribellus luteus]|uniref:SH3 domain-containing protein n=1 Tax=Maribellus luteus TaxID=2305463 RepID=A0A399T5M7_9BACT|nr:hypothetical protein [Maribellus luteus]RIJ49193.1 hypothetical protein D1614_06435 [Maribellus luteus]
MPNSKTICLLILTLVFSGSVLISSAQKTDTPPSKKEIRTLDSKDASVKMNATIRKNKSGKVSRIIDTPINFQTDDTLILVNGKKKVKLENINPQWIKSVQVFKNEDVPARYRKKGITRLIKVKIKKPLFAGKKHR